MNYVVTAECSPCTKKKQHKNQTKIDDRVSEGYVSKFGAKWCVFRSKLDDLLVLNKQIKFNEIMRELDGLFEDAIRQVREKKSVVVL